MKQIKTILIALLVFLIGGEIYAQRTVAQDPTLTLTVLSQNDPTTCGGADGGISVSAVPTPVGYIWSNGSSSATLVNLPANTYTVTATSSQTVCTATQTVTLAGVSAPVITAQPIGDFLCVGESFTISVNATGSGLTYQWSNNTIPIPGATSATYTVPAAAISDAGSYRVAVYSGSCQTNSNVANIAVYPSPVVNVADQTVTWPNTSATFNAFVTGCTYSWSTGMTTPSITVNTAGTYTVTVTNANNCSTIDNATLTVNGGPLAISSITANPANICIGESSQLNLVVIDGTPPYTYSWSNGGTGMNTTVTPTSQTTYTVLVSDASGATVTGSVTVFVDTPPTANAGMDQTINITDTTQIGTPAAPGCTYAWSNGSTLANPLVWPAVTTQYTVTVTNTGGCTATDQVTVFVIGGPFVFADPIVPITSSLGTTILQGQTTQLTTLVSGGTPPYAYSWTSVPVGFTSTVYNPYTQPLVTTTYTVLATDALGATLTAQITIIVPPNPPSASVGYNTQNQTICAGDSASFVINTSGIYPLTVVYNDGTGPITISNINTPSYVVWVHPTVTTNYLLMNVTDSLNQSTVCGGGFTITVNPSPVVNLGVDHTVCSGASVVLADQSGGNYSIYQWSSGGTNAQTMVNPTTTTTYVLTAINTPSMCSGTDTVIVNVNPLATIIASANQSICAGQSVTLSATGGVSYNWMPVGLSGDSITVTPTDPFTQYTVTGYNGFGCPGTDIVNVIMNPLPTADAGADQTICTGSPATLNATGGGTYLWSNSAITASTTVTPATTTIYTVTVTSAQQCTDVDTVIVIVSPYPTVDAGLDIAVCVGQNETFNITTTGTVISYNWLPATGLNDASIANPTVTPSVAGTVTYTIQVSNAAGCSVFDQINVTGNPIPVITANDVFICEGDAITLNASAIPNSCTFNWSPPAGLSATNIANPVANPTTTTTYTIIAMSPNNCPGSKTITVTVQPLPVADFAAYVVPDSSGRVEFTNYSTDATSYSWDFGDGNSSTLSDPIYTYTINGSFNVWLTATNSCGSDMINHFVSGIYIGIEELPIEAANINIYPNPAVDIVHIAGVENIESFRVSNAIGQIVFEQKVLSNETTVSFDVSQYPAGIYHITFTTTKGNIFPAVIVKGQ